MEVLFEFVEACGEPSELFEVAEGAFDAVALFVQRAVEGALLLAIAARRDDSGDATFGQMFDDGGAVIALVGQYGFGLPFAQQGKSLGAVMGLTGCQVEAERQAKFVGQQMDLGRQTSSTPPQSGVRSPFFRAEAACWWARTTLESIIT